MMDDEWEFVGPIFREAWRAALAATPKGESEREAFERATAHIGLDYEQAGLSRKADGCTYWQAETEAAWCAWRAVRAALARPEPEPEPDADVLETSPPLVVRVRRHPEPEPELPALPTEGELLQAIARAWCHFENANKVVDPVLAKSIVEEVAAILADRKRRT